MAFITGILIGLGVIVGLIVGIVAVSILTGWALCRYFTSKTAS